MYMYTIYTHRQVLELDTGVKHHTIIRHFFLSCFGCLVNSTVNRTFWACE